MQRLWINKGSDIWNQFAAALEHKETARVEAIPWCLNAEGWTVRPEGKFENLITAWDDSGYRCYVHFPGLVRESWEFDRIADPFLLWNAVKVFYERLNTFPAYPQKNSREVLEASWNGNWPRLLSDDPETYWQPFIGKMESEFIWLRAPNATEGKEKFVHAFDKRMMFLSAARGGMFGPGEYEVVENTNYRKLGKKAVGIVKLKKPPKFSDAMFPEFAKFLQKLFGKTDIFYTPYLALFEDYVVNLDIEKGWVWREPHRIFEKYAKTLGDAVKATREWDPDLAAANRAFKSLYTMFFGWLGRLENRTGYAAELFRPDWRGLIVAGAGANLIRNIRDVYIHTQRLPFAINHDCLMYFSESENWQMDFGKTAVCDPNKFTHEWTATAKQVKSVLRDGVTNPMMLEKAVTKL